MLVLGACGAGTGEGLDQNGQPLAAGGGPVPLEPTLASIQANVFSVACISCHGGAGAPEGLSLEPGISAVNLIGVPVPRNSTLIRVIPGNPDESFLIQKLEGRQGLLGDRMPANGLYLPQATINVIRLWIQNLPPQ
jgi:mono/diheme cytochrome c family protein